MQFKSKNLVIVLAVGALLAVLYFGFAHPRSSKQSTGDTADLPNLSSSDIAIGSASGTVKISKEMNLSLIASMSEANYIDKTVSVSVPSEQKNTMSLAEFTASFPHAADKELTNEQVRMAADQDTLVDADIALSGGENLSSDFVITGNPTAYKSDGKEIVYSESIKNLADKLKRDPLSMLNYVRNNISYVPYYGSKKGAAATLWEHEGNDIDQASLLVALLRYSGFPARYARANVKIDIGTMTDLLGVGNSDAVARILGTQSIPYALVTDNQGNPQFFALEHVYVEAYIPYGYSRGASREDGGVQMWVPMDPSINAYYYEQSEDVVSEMRAKGLTSDSFFQEYLSGKYGFISPKYAFEQMATEFIKINPPRFSPKLTYKDSLVRRYPKDQNLDLIPGTLPYEVLNRLVTWDFVPDEIRHTVLFRVYDNNGKGNEFSLFVSDIAEQEVVLGYSGATDSDTQKLKAHKSIFDISYPADVRLKPYMSLNGRVVVVGEANLPMASTQIYDIVYRYPVGSMNDPLRAKDILAIHESIVVGDSIVIAFDTGSLVPSVLLTANEQHSSSSLGVQVMHSAGEQLLNFLEVESKEGARFLGGGFTDLVTLAITQSMINIAYDSNGTPTSFRWASVRIKPVSYVLYYNQIYRDTTLYADDFRYFYALEASYREATTLKDMFKVQTISGLGALQQVSAIKGAHIVKIESDQMKAFDSLQLSIDGKEAIAELLKSTSKNAVYLPSVPISYFGWSGIPFAFIDDASGSILFGLAPSP